MEFLESFVAFTNDILWSYVLIVMLVGLGIWFSLRTRFVQVRCLKEMVIKGLVLRMDLVII